MVSGAFVGDKLLVLVVCEHTMDFSKYIELLKSNLLPFLKRGFKLMHDGASIHISNLTKDWLKNNKIESIEWPAHSPDLNPMENLWSILTRAVFTGGRQFKNKNELKEEILKKWSLIQPKTLTNLVNSIYDRIIAVKRQKGANTKY
jgi:transposase